MSSYIATVLRLTIFAVLFVAACGLVRVLIELRVQQRRKQQLAATQDICTLSPSEFEAYVALLFERTGYQVRHTGGSGDHGVDLVVRRRGTSSVVQCKRYEEAVGPRTVRELIGAMTNANVQEGFLITTSSFTAGAQREALRAPYKVNLIDGEKLVQLAKTHGLPGELMDRKQAL